MFGRWRRKREEHRADKQQATFSRMCLLGRRLLERGVRFVSLYCGASNNVPDFNWDAHANLEKNHRLNAGISDQPVAALLTDLKQRGLLEDTLIIWGGEFGRTSYSQGKLTKDNYGRDHHGQCFTVWLAGGGIKPGVSYGETDEFSYNVARDPVPVHDLQATILHCLGIDHTKLTYRFQGRDFRLTDVSGAVVNGILV